jgi:hypothetical protein
MSPRAHLGVTKAQGLANKQARDHASDIYVRDVELLGLRRYADDLEGVIKTKDRQLAQLHGPALKRALDILMGMTIRDAVRLRLVDSLEDLVAWRDLVANLQPEPVPVACARPTPVAGIADPRNWKPKTVSPSRKGKHRG